MDVKIGKVRGYQETNIFENQRYRPLFGWGSKGYLFTNERTEFSDETGEKRYEIKDLEEILPPSNFEWVTTWTINYSYTKVDLEGWCYATTFQRLSEKLVLNKSSNKVKPGHVVRRRLWTRLSRALRSSIPLLIDRVTENNLELQGIEKEQERQKAASFPLQFSIEKIFNSKTKVLDSPNDGPEIIIAVLYENERFDALQSSLISSDQSFWSALNLSQEFLDWSPFTDITGKHEVIYQTIFLIFYCSFSNSSFSSSSITLSLYLIVFFSCYNTSKMGICLAWKLGMRCDHKHYRYPGMDLCFKL